MNERLTKSDYEQVGHFAGSGVESLQAKGGLDNPSVVIDTRAVTNSTAIFVALKGEMQDGHAFVAQAFEKGVGLCLVSRAWFNENEKTFADKNFLVAEDTEAALQKLANVYRKKFLIPVVAVTGSSGKTTTKDMIAAVLSKKYHVAKTEGKLNNHLGVPLTIFRFSPETEIAVVEMGMNHYGEIKNLCSLAEPTHGLITNVGTAHIEFFGNRENIAAAKGEMFDYVGGTGGTLFVNADDALVLKKSEAFERKIFYGLDAANTEVSGKLESLGKLAEPTLVLQSGAKQVKVSMKVSGRHFAINAVAAAAVGLNFGVSLSGIKAALESYEPKENSKRMEVKKISIKSGEIFLFNDAYNANTESMMAALETLSLVETTGKRIAVLGDMLEMGEQSKAEHQRVGKKISDLNAAAEKINALLTFGEAAKHIAEEARVKTKLHFTDKDKLTEKLFEMIESGDAALIKGSRGMKMEAVADGLLREEKNHSTHA
jgi:UDP-N-acetylmuramoyl-tripeptide--D-alanyl-D-alanine ligase